MYATNHIYVSLFVWFGRLHFLSFFLSLLFLFISRLKLQPRVYLSLCFMLNVFSSSITFFYCYSCIYALHSSLFVFGYFDERYYIFAFFCVFVKFSFSLALFLHFHVALFSFVTRIGPLLFFFCLFAQTVSTETVDVHCADTSYSNLCNALDNITINHKMISCFASALMSFCYCISCAHCFRTLGFSFSLTHSV